MFIIGLTGSIGMGKTETARLFERAGVPCYDADAAVHALYARGGAAVAPVGALFSEAVKNDSIDRDALSRAVLGDPEKIAQLEAVVHPLVGRAQREFLDRHAANGTEQVVLDIPLLLETGGQKRVDAVVVVSAPPDVQRQRVLARANMTEAKLEAVLAKQMPDAEKRAKADFIVDTGVSIADAERQICDILETLRGRKGRAYERLKTPDA